MWEKRRLRPCLDLGVKISVVSHRIHGHTFEVLNNKHSLIPKQITESACKLRDELIKPN